MSNSENDIRLEQRSRDAASGYTPPGKASWEKMEAALDQVMPVQEKKRRRFIFWWLLPLLFVGAVAIYLNLQPDENGSNKSNKNISSTNPATSSEETKVAGNKITENNKATSVNEQQTLSSTKNAPNNLSAENKSALVKPGTVKQQNLAPGQHNNSEKKPTSPDLINKDYAQEKNTADKINSTTFDKKQTDQSNTQNSSGQDSQSGLQQTNSKLNNPANTITIKPDTGSTNTNTGILVQKNDSSMQLSLATNDTLIKDNNMPKTNKSPDSKFSFALVGGMDASTVKFRYSSKAGINAGFITGYHFNETWSVHTGVLFTKKNYSMAGQDFHAPKGSWVANYKLTMVEGYCNMWEVPLLVRYKFNGAAKRGFFVSTGISSYFMTRENYNYSYYWNGQPITRNSNYPTGNTHLLSILKLSAGWRKSIGPGTSILIEPYAALPLTGLGYGSIRLSSFGLNFSLQLRQPYEKK